MGARVLIVDSREAARVSRAMAFRAAGFDAVHVGTDETALAVATAARPTLALIEVGLPDLDGIDLCRRLRAAAKTASVPILLVCATPDAETARRCAAEARANSYLNEPVAGGELVAASRALLRRRRTDLQAPADNGAAALGPFYDEAPIGLCVLDENLCYVHINRRLAEMNGHSPKAHIGRTVRDMIASLADQVEPVLREVIHTGVPRLEWEIAGDTEAQPGVQRLAIASCWPQRDPASGARVLALAVSEITRERQREAALREQAAELAEANRLKDAFLATLSHELRTPLNVILGWAELVMCGTLDRTATQHAIEVIERNARAEARLVADLLDLVRITTGKIRLDTRPVDLAESVLGAVDSVRPAAERKSVALAVTVNHPSPIVAGDADRLRQIWLNLLTNALKFTPEGNRIDVAVRADARGVAVDVRDTGIGIEPGFLPFVFDRFRQSDRSLARSHGGLGLGLSIVRSLAELHGGHATAESAGEGHGATFTISLPLLPDGLGRTVQAARRAEDERGTVARPEVPAAALAGLRVVVVDDDGDAREMVSTVLRAYGGEVRACEAASAAFDLVRTWRPALLVSDLGLRGEDGYALIRRIRALPPEEGGDTPALAISAYTRADDTAEALSAGFEAFLQKPLAPDLLVGAAVVLLRRDPPAS